MQPNKTWFALMLGAATLSYTADGFAAGPSPENDPAHVEKIPETKLSRVTLKPRAAERLGIQTAAVVEVTVARTRIVAADVLKPSEAERLGLRPPGGRASLSKPGSVATASADPTVMVAAAEAAGNPQDPGIAWVRAIPIGDADRLDRGEAAQVFPLARGGPADRFKAEPVMPPSTGTGNDQDHAFYYLVDNGNHGLVPEQRVLIEMSYGKVHRKSVPFSSVIHNERGEAWVYTMPQPLVFVRHRIEIDYVSDDVAFLTEGPPSGTVVVSVGAPMLFGTEFKVGK
jgi:hypothetical protein